MSDAVLGIEQAIESLNELDRKLQRKIIRKGVRAGGKVMQAAAKSEAPNRSGKLSSKIKVRAAKSKKGSIGVTIGVGAKDFTGEAFYAGFLTYGWRSGPRKLGDARKFNKPNNFLDRACKSSESQASETALETIAAEIEAETSK